MCLCAPTYDLCLLGWPILSDETFLVVLAGRAVPGPVSRDGASQVQMSRLIDALNLAEIELAAHQREPVAPEDPGPVRPALSASQQASQIKSMFKSVSRFKQSIPNQRCWSRGCRGTYLARVPTSPTPDPTSPRSCPSVGPCSLQPGPNLPTLAGWPSKIEIINREAIDVLWYSCVPSRLWDAGCGTVPSVDVRCWLWYTSCTSRITSDKRLPPPPPASSAQTPFPVVPRSLPCACLCPPFARPRFAVLHH